MKTPVHFLIGGTAAILPDLLLLGFGWRRRWVTADEKTLAGALLRAHLFLHSPSGLVAVLLVGWCSHILVDWCSPHRRKP